MFGDRVNIIRDSCRRMLDKEDLEEILEFNELEPLDVLVYLAESGMIVIDDDDELDVDES